MPFWIRALCGILAFIFLVWGILGLLPFVPGGFVCFPISVTFFGIARIPFISKLVKWLFSPFYPMARKLSIWFSNQPWGMPIRKKMADFVKFLRSKKSKKQDDKDKDG